MNNYSHLDLRCNSNVAHTLGTNHAIIIGMFQGWIGHNATHNISYAHQDKRWWTFQTLDSITAWAPNLSKSSVQRILKELESLGVLITGYYHQNKTNRTKWYSINEEALGKIVNARLKDNPRPRSPWRVDHKEPSDPTETPSGQADHMEVVKPTTSISKEHKGKEGNTPLPPAPREKTMTPQRFTDTCVEAWNKFAENEKRWVTHRTPSGSSTVRIMTSFLRGKEKQGFTPEQAVGEFCKAVYWLNRKETWWADLIRDGKMNNLSLNNLMTNGKAERYAESFDNDGLSLANVFAVPDAQKERDEVSVGSVVRYSVNGDPNPKSMENVQLIQQINDRSWKGKDADGNVMDVYDWEIHGLANN